MSKPLIVSIPHSLRKKEALRRLKAGMERVISHVPLMKVEEQTWSGDRMTFRASALGQVAAGTIDVGESEVRLELTLPGCSRASRKWSKTPFPAGRFGFLKIGDGNL